MMSSSVKEVEDAESWQYRGEGAANIVLAYRGDDPALIGNILRLRKAVKNDDTSAGNAKRSTPVLSAEEQQVWADWPDLVSATTTAELNHAYARDVLCPLLGAQHVVPGTLVHVSSSFIEALNRNIGHKRPKWRAEDASLEALTGIGLLISDHTCFPSPAGNVQVSSATVTVELKPKCGFLPTSPKIKEENRAKKSFSRFAMHQHLKFHQGKIEQISKYDPLDLFSGTKDGILKAIQALFETPQNNLRIFLNGEEVFGASEGSSSRDKLSIAHFEDVLQGFVPAKAGGRLEAFQELVAEILFASDILSKLLAVQKLDYHDIEGAIEAYNTFLSFDKHLSENSVKEQDFNVPREGAEESQCQDKASESITLTSSFEDCRKILRDFLISATAKDCGLMLTLQPVGGKNVGGVYFQNASIVSSSDQPYLHKILLLDLDVKRLKKMNHYLKLDQEIIKAYTSIPSS